MVERGKSIEAGYLEMAELTQAEIEYAAEMIRDPFLYIKYFLRVDELTEGQKEVVLSVMRNKYTAVTSSPGIGKSFVAACVLLWFLNSKPHSKVISTAPSARQVEDILWSEISHLLKSLPMPLGKKLQTDLIIDDDWFATGITTSAGEEHAVAEKIKGYHAPGGVLVILDEATGVHPAIWESLKTVVAGDNCKVLAIGNPSTNNCEFRTFCDREDTNVIILSALDHPNIIHRREIIPGAIDIRWVKEVIADHCKVVETHNPLRKTFAFDGKIYLPDSLATWQLLGTFPSEASSKFLYMLDKKVHGICKVPNYVGPITCFIDYGRVCVGMFGRVDNEGNRYIFDEWYEDDPLHELKDRAISFNNFCIKRGYREFLCWGDTDLHNEPSVLYTAAKQQAPVETFRQICKDLNITFKRIVKKGRDDIKTYRKYCNTVVKEGLNYRVDSNGIFTKIPTIFIDAEKCTNFWKTVPLLRPSKIEPDWDYDQSDTRVDDHNYESFKGLIVCLKKPVIITEEDRQKMIYDMKKRAEATPF